jgi:hypothetical protein
MKKIIETTTLAVFFIGLVGCAQTSAGESSQTQNGITAVFSMSPISPMMMEPTTLSLTLYNADGLTVEGAQVSIDLSMPAMAMPANQQQASDQGQGLYLAEAIFTMSGEWHAQVTVEQSGETTIFDFDFSVK